MIKYKHVTIEWKQFMLGYAKDRNQNFICIGPITIYFEI